MGVLRTLQIVFTHRKCLRSVFLEISNSSTQFHDARISRFFEVDIMLSQFYDIYVEEVRQLEGDWSFSIV